MSKLVKPEQARRTREMIQQELLAQSAHVRRQIGSIATAEGWKYIRATADQILDEYKCAPPKTESEKQKWETYTHMKWAFDKLFATVNEIAPKGQPLTDSPRVVIQNDDKRSSKFRTKPPGTTSGDAGN